MDPVLKTRSDTVDVKHSRGRSVTQENIKEKQVILLFSLRILHALSSVWAKCKMSDIAVICLSAEVSIHAKKY